MYQGNGWVHVYLKGVVWSSSNGAKGVLGSYCGDDNFQHTVPGAVVSDPNAKEVDELIDGFAKQKEPLNRTQEQDDLLCKLVKDQVEARVSPDMAIDSGSQTTQTPPKKRGPPKKRDSDNDKLWSGQEVSEVVSTVGQTVLHPDHGQGVVTGFNIGWTSVRFSSGSESSQQSTPCRKKDLTLSLTPPSSSIHPVDDDDDATPKDSFDIQKVLQRPSIRSVPGSELGCDDTWTCAVDKVRYTYYLQSPSGRRFTSKRKAVEHFEEENSRTPKKAGGDIDSSADGAGEKGATNEGGEVAEATTSTSSGRKSNDNDDDDDNATPTDKGWGKSTQHLEVGALVEHPKHGQGSIEEIGPLVKVKILKRKRGKPYKFTCESGELRLLLPGELVEGPGGEEKVDFWEIGDFLTARKVGQGTIMNLKEDGMVDLMLANGEVETVALKDLKSVNMQRTFVGDLESVDSSSGSQQC